MTLLLISNVMESLLTTIAQFGLDVNRYRLDALNRKSITEAYAYEALEDVLLTLFHYLKGGYNPNQPRVPAGNPNGGQWTTDFDYISRQHGWGDAKKLEDHVKNHGKQFNTNSASEYARKAQAFRKKAIENKFPAVQDKYGNTRYYDPKTKTFGAYNNDGSTRTFYKPRGGTRYFENQMERYGPKDGGRIINNLPDSERSKPKPQKPKPPRGGGMGGGSLIDDNFPFGLHPNKL